MVLTKLEETDWKNVFNTWHVFMHFCIILSFHKHGIIILGNLSVSFFFIFFFAVSNTYNVHNFLNCLLRIYFINF